uniref:Uncharacterized protein n=1 Tax=Coccidioides posadasii RMSCC 3488 TaxID=454284 RepID=A0A0J6IH30_COCPO|nr:hypothetical protein CPAG_07424 [Coccidioides posadasii RMSCC 3488]
MEVAQKHARAVPVRIINSDDWLVICLQETLRLSSYAQRPPVAQGNAVHPSTTAITPRRNPWSC